MVVVCVVGVLSGVHIRVVDLFSVKPIDVQTLVTALQESQGRLIVVEDHYQAGGIFGTQHPHSTPPPYSIGLPVCLSVYCFCYIVLGSLCVCVGLRGGDVILAGGFRTSGVIPGRVGRASQRKTCGTASSIPNRLRRHRPCRSPDHRTLTDHTTDHTRIPVLTLTEEDGDGKRKGLDGRSTSLAVPTIIILE